MSDQTRDPIRQLADLTSAQLPVAPLAPAEVRRLGDRRRARRHAAVAAAAVLLAVAVAVPVGLIAGRGGSDAEPPITEAPTVITFPGGGVQVTSPGETDKLEGTSQEFKSFIAGVWQHELDQGCPTPTITVSKYSSAGYALGGVGGCGGYVALWVGQDGHWKEALGTQDEWRCGDLSRFEVPTSFAGECYGPAALFGPTEDAGVRLGMSRDEVLAAGGTVTGSADGCQLVSPPGLQPEKDATLGYLSAVPGKGVVALFAQRDQVTPEGIGRYSSKEDVERAYPEGHLDPLHGAWIAPIDDHSHYRFDLDHDSVRLVSIEAEGTQDCYE